MNKSDKQPQVYIGRRYDIPLPVWNELLKIVRQIKDGKYKIPPT